MLRMKYQHCMYENQLALEKLKDSFEKDGRILSLGSHSKWKEKDFKQLAKLISNFLSETDQLSPEQKIEIGPSISAVTLKRVFKYGYQLSNSIDIRQLRTLNKLCLFLGFQNWEAFLVCHKDSISIDLSEETIKEIITQGCQAEFEAYYAIPEIKTKALDEYFVPEGPAWKKITSLVHRTISKKWILNFTDNPSHYKIISLEVTSIKGDQIEVKSKENWYLKWMNAETNISPFVYNELNEQYYLLSQHNGQWKIDINYYQSPNADNVVVR